MTVTPKQLREAADTLDAAASTTIGTTAWPYTAIRLRSLADKLDIPVGTVRKDPDSLSFYIKAGENSWVGVYLGEGQGSADFGYFDNTVDYAPIVHRLS